MAYITKTDIETRLEKDDIGELSNDETGATDKDTIINGVIYEAQAVVDSYAAVNYTTPFTEPAPVAIRNVTTTIAVYTLHMRRDWTISEALRQHYEDAIDWLEKLASNKVMLDVSNSDNAGGYFDAETRIFQGISHDQTTDLFNGF